MARSQFFVFIVSLIFSSMSCYALETSNAGLGFNIAKIQKLTGQTGQLDQDQKIYKITVPRDDLKILMSGMQMTPDMGLSSWITFKKTNNQTLVNGDLILLQDQINPVMSVALTNGLQVTGLHSPYLWDSPRVIFMHITGEGDELQLASAIGQVLKKIKATSNGGGDFPLGNFDFLRTTLSAHKIDVILGQKGQFKDDVYKIEFSDGIKPTDTEASKVIALNTWAAFAGSDNEAVVNGTIVLHESELQKALVKLRSAQIYILAIYQHMVNDNRDLVLINFWGIGNTQTLAKALRSVFVIAQNNNPTNITVGEILPDISTVNAETEVGMTPVQLSLYKNDNCGYAKAKELYTSVDTIQNKDADYAKQLGETLRIALNLTQKIVSEKITNFVSFLPVTSQMIQSTEETAQALPSAKNLLLKLSVVSNNVPEFVKLLASTSIVTPVKSGEKTAVSYSAKIPSAVLSIAQNTASKSSAPSVTTLSENLLIFKSRVGVLTYQPGISLLTHFAEGTKALANAIPVIFLNVGARFHTYTTKLTTSYIESTESHINSISSSATFVYTQIDEFLTSCANILKSLAHATSTAVLRDISEFSALYINVSQSFDHATFTAVAYVDTHINEVVILSVNMPQSFAHAISTAIAHVYATIAEFSISSASVSQFFTHAVSAAVAHVYANINKFAVLSVNVSKSLAHAASVAVAHDINVLAALFFNVSQSFDYATFAAVARVNTHINEFAILSVNMSKSVANVACSAGAHVHTNINKLSVLFVSISQSVTNSISVVVAHAHANINELAVLSVSVSKVLAHATSFVSSKAIDFAHFYVTGFIASFTQSFSVVKNTVTQLAQSSANKTFILLAAIKKPAPSAVNLTAQNKMNPLLQPLSMPANASAESILKSGSTLFSPPVVLATTYASAAKNSSYDTLTTAFAVVEKNAAKEMTQSSSKPLAAVAETKNKIPSMLKPLAKIFSPTLLPPPRALPAPDSTVQVAQKSEVDAAKLVKNKPVNIVQVTPKIGPFISSVKEAGISQSEKTAVKVPPVSAVIIKNTVIEVAKVPEKIVPLSFPLAGSKTTEVVKPLKKILTADSSVASDQSHDQITKSLSAALPVSQRKIITVSSGKIVPASLPMPQHKVIRVATLSPLSSVMPVTHHKVKAVSVMQHKTIKVTKLSPQSLPSPQSRKNHNVTKVKLIMKPLASLEQTKTTQYREQPNKVKITSAVQHKNMKLAKLSSRPLLHTQSIKNHNVSRIKYIVKPSASFAHTKHREQLNKELSVTLHATHNKPARYAPSRVAIYPVAHNINHQPARKIVEKPREIAHAMPHEEDWSTEKLAPEPPIRVAQQHVYHGQEEFDDGPALVGAYPYDEEPASGGFGG